MKQSQCAFTLVELSIVLVILGLLVGGVLTGQSLIRAAELRSVSTQFNQFVTATQTFRDKYFALPGDMPNAQSYWGVANASASTCVTTASTDTKTCNGDGNGLVDNSAGANEYFRYWQHLANAGLIEGSYDGIPHGSSATATTKANAAAGRIGTSLWFTASWGTIVGGSVVALFDGQYGNSLELGGPVTNNDPFTTIFKPEEVYNIDMKMDDGKPATGKVVARSGNGLSLCTDTSSSTNMNANYLLSSTAANCTIMFRQAF